MKVLLAAGGSGGHIFPAVALARAIKKDRPSASLKFVGSSKEIDRRIFEKERFDYFLVTSNKFPYGASPYAVVFIAKFIYDLARCVIRIAACRPDVICGFGGYVSCPVMIAGRILGIPCVLHEQNVVPGRANKLLFGLAGRIALSFEETLPLIGGLAKKAVVTGNPIRTDDFLPASLGSREQLSKRLGLDGSKFTVLVIGGSQGAHRLNETFIEAISRADPGTRSSMQVVHITGNRDYQRALDAYRALGIESKVYSFIDKIEEAYGAADLAVTRAGASAIFELAFFAKPMILVPYPFAKSHQRENASALSKKGAAVMIEEKDLCADSFMGQIKAFAGDPGMRGSFSRSARRVSAPQASRDLAREVFRMAGGGNAAA